MGRGLRTYRRTQEVSCPFIIRPEAEADLAEGFDWYEERRSGLGEEFLNEVQTRLRKIEENPLRHAVVYRNRSWSLNGGRAARSGPALRVKG